jgi:hypothetical protein
MHILQTLLSSPGAVAMLELPQLVWLPVWLASVVKQAADGREQNMLTKLLLISSLVTKHARV